MVATGAANVRFAGFEFWHVRGSGIVLDNCTNVTVSDSVIADVGMVGLNISNGAGCGAVDTTIAGCGDAGVILSGGDRQTLTPSGHCVHSCSLHLNQRWILNYAPHVIVLGVGQSITNSELYNAANQAVMLLGNDHTLHNSYIHDVTQQCQDCGAFYTGRALTYRGNVVANNTWRRCQSIWGDDTEAI